MSIASKLTKLETDIANVYDLIEEKGGIIPQNKNTENMVDAISSIPAGSSINLFIQDEQPEGYDGIWIADSSLSNYSIIEIDSVTRLVANSINIITGTKYSTKINPYLTYNFTGIDITDANNNIMKNINVYYGDGSSWVLVPIISKYTELEYIQGTGSQYINTDYTPSNDTKIELTLSDITTSGEGGLMGASTVWGSNSFLLFKTSNIAWAFRGFIDMTNNLTAKHTISLYREVVDLDGVNIYNNSTPNPNVTINKVLSFFTAGNKSSAYKLYGSKIWDYSTGVLIKDFIPVKDFNGIVCLYDKVNEQYFYNSGTGTFIAGPEK